jgi:hypothetical protein
LEDGECADEELACLLFELLDETHKLLVELDSLPDGYFQILWLAAVSSCSSDGDVDDGDLAHDWSCLAPQLPEATSGPVVEAVYFIHTLETALLDH